MNSHFSSLYRDYPNSLTLSNASELFWSWFSINHIQVHKGERKFCHCLFTSFTKPEIRHFHVVVVQWRQRNLQNAWCTSKVVVLPCQAIAFLILSRRRYIVTLFFIIYDTLWCVRNRIFSVQIELLLLIGSETFFDSSVVPSFLVRKAWWTNRATGAK